MINDKRIHNYEELSNSLNQFLNNQNLNLNDLIKNGNYQGLHHKICKFMFDRAENGEELWIRIDEQDDDTILENENNYLDGERKYFRVSIMTQTMLDYDRMMLTLIAQENQGDITVENRYATYMYRPYFYNFLIDVKEIDRPSSIIFLRENTNQWFTGRFKKSEYDEGRSFLGYIEMMASPAEYKDYKIIISDKRLSKKILDEINDLYDLGPNPCVSDIDVNIELVNILEKPQFIEAKIYNVGNGNCIYLKGRNSFGNLRILYDIGYYCKKPSKRNIITTYQSSVKAIRYLKPHCIILSHWDCDHFFGCAYADTKIFQCKWFAPNLDDDTVVSAKRVAKYLQVLNNLVLVGRTMGRQIACIKGYKSQLKLFMGEKRRGKDYNITACNKEGIVLELVNNIGLSNEIHSLMAGDVPYESLPSSVNFSKNIPYDYLIVPHHGSKMDTTLLSPPATKKDGHAIICATSKCSKCSKRSKCTKHIARIAHENKLSQNGYTTVDKTGNANTYFYLDLLHNKKPTPR